MKRTKQKQLGVPCTRKIQKSMLKSMVNTIKLRLNNVRRQKAAELLATILGSSKSETI